MRNLLKGLIQDAVVTGKMFYDELTYQQKCSVVSASIKEMSYLFKASILTDADHESELPDLLADVISTNRGKEAVEALLNKLEEIFITGNKRKEAYFTSDIDHELEQERKFMFDPINYIDDLFKQDAVNRAKDMNKALGGAA